LLPVYDPAEWTNEEEEDNRPVNFVSVGWDKRVRIFLDPSRSEEESEEANKEIVRIHKDWPTIDPKSNF
jgi:hypothetical protein